jgi:amino acid adenylation domain-containing protein
MNESTQQFLVPVSPLAPAPALDGLRYDAEGSIPDRFETLARCIPDRVAVKTKKHQLTFDSLNANANRVAQALSCHGAGFEDPIAILLERGARLSEALLGVLKAGHVYVALNPSHPVQRARHILDDSQARLVVTDDQYRTLSGELVGNRIRLLNMDRIDPGVSSANLARSIHPDNTACITYTSGSTGRPKGVIHTHRSVLHRQMAGKSFRIGVDDRVAVVGSAGTDNFRALLNGAGAFPWNVKEEGFHNLAHWMRNERITVFHSVPSVFRDFMAALKMGETFPDLRLIILRGETLYRRDVEKFREFIPPHCVLVNEFGSSETRTIAQFAIHKETPVTTNIVPVGRVLEGKSVLLLDDAGNEVGAGQIGEIAVKSRFISPGYWRNPGLTNARYRPDPHGGAERIFLTGDLGCMLPDGYLMHVGRKDSQVKIRGQRIELVEIEGALRQLYNIRDAAVVAREDQPGDKRLVAYVAANKAPPPTVSALVRGLKEQLPDYMVPAAFVVLESLPMTPSGKIDRLALPPPERARPNLAVPYAVPRDAIEKTLVQFWSEVLDVDRMGIKDDFFELGGDSLRVTMVHSRIVETFRVDLPLRDIFRLRTVEALAAAISAAPVQPVCRPEALNPIRAQSRASAIIFPASFAQQRMWLLDRIEASAAYNDVIAWRMAGPLDREALRHALNAVVNRHEVLRTTFSSTGEHVVQMIAESVPVELPIIDLERRHAGSERDAALDEVLVMEARRPFDLSRDAVMRANLVRLSDRDHVLALTLHHIATDGWSAGILARELSALYNAACDGVEPRLAELPIQYADYSVWQRVMLSGDELQRQLAYWKKQLHGAPDTLELPADRPRANVKSFDGARHSFQFSSELASSLHELCRKSDTTLFATTAAAFATLLNRYSASQDVVFGTPIAGRRRVETEHLIGFFVNTLALRIDLSGDPTFRELLQRVHGVAYDAFAHQDVPFEKLVEELQPHRRLSHSPLFQIMFALQNAPRSELKLKDVESRRISVHNRTSKFDLTMSLVDAPEGLRGRIVYDTQLFDPSTIQRLCGHFEVLLAGIVASPECRLSELPLLPAGERELLLNQWSGATAEVPIEETIHRLFEARAAATPDAIAVMFEGQSVTYRQLNERANRLAHRLRALTYGPGTPVALCLERSIELVIGLLGVLKSGGAYVSLDPSHPPQRLAQVLQASGAPVLLTHTQFRDRFPGSEVRVVCLDDMAEDAFIAGHSDQNPDQTTSTAELAYVIFTSGSTGTPKGVAIPHRAVIRLVRSTNYIELTPADVVAQMSNSSFDAATFEVWGALLNGAKLVVFPTDVVLSPTALSARLRSERVSALFVTTALFKQIVFENPTAFSTVRSVLFGGEVVDPQCVRDVLAKGPPERLLHVYGPTETTTFATFHRIEHVREDAVSIPIGRPISNTSVYVLDPRLQPVPIGVPGELCIGGPGLAVGYPGSPELTAEKFVPHPFSIIPGDRLYRTGDIVRWRADGTLDFLGRRDNQVKIRGFRVEPGEVEAALSEHPRVRENVVVVREDVNRGRYLTAYFVPQTDDAPLPVDLRSFLSGRLPDYMVPSAFVQIERLPLTPNGKLDRRALPVPELVQRDDLVGYIPPAGEVEQKLAAIWSDLLGRRGIGANDNFFNLGGHSLLALRLLSRVEQAWGKAPPLKAVFQHPTLRQFAFAMESLSRTDTAPAIVCLRAALENAPDERAPVLIAPSLFGHFHEWESLFTLAARDRTIYGLEVTGSRPYWTDRPSLIEIAQGFFELLKERFPDGEFHLIGHSFGGALAYEVGRQFEACGRPPLSVLLVDTAARATSDAWRVRDVSSILLNFPRWLSNELATYSLRELAGRVSKDIGTRTESIDGDGRFVEFRLQRFFDLSALPTVYQERLKQGYEAFRDYQPQSTQNRVVYLRCRIRPPIHRLRPDGGWKALVPGGSLDIVPITGEHGSALHPKRHAALAEVLNQCLHRVEIARTTESHSLP